jgi:hypothetical protein
VGATWKSELKLLQEVGVCFGQDMRQLLLDGLPFSSVTVSDLTDEFW